MEEIDAGCIIALKGPNLARKFQLESREPCPKAEQEHRILRHISPHIILGAAAEREVTQASGLSRESLWCWQSFEVGQADDHGSKTRRRKHPESNHILIRGQRDPGQHVENVGGCTC